MKDENIPSENARKTAPEVSESELLAPEIDPDVEALKSAQLEADLPDDDDISDGDMPDDLEAAEEPQLASKAVVMSEYHGLKRWWHGYGHHKKWTIPLTILVLLGVAIAVPQSRYPLLSRVVQRDYTVQVLDSATRKPVTNAAVVLNGEKKETDNYGKVRFHTKVGQGELAASKKYYRENKDNVVVAAWGNQPTYQLYLHATGRQVTVTVINKISGDPIENALVRAVDTEARTDNTGKAMMVLPADQPTIDASLSADGYHSLDGKVAVMAKTVLINKFALTPSGSVYFLSNLSGKIDVVKTNLDGSDRQTVLAGTGNESNHDTTLMQSSDWKYLVLKSKRSTDPAKLYLIDTASDKVTTMDEGDADFTPVGWSDHHFVYVVSRHNVPYWKPYAQALKTYDAESGKVTIIDQTAGEGSNQFDYGYNIFSTVYIQGNELVYAKNWYGSGYAPNHLNGKHLVITSAQVDGSGKRTIKDFPIPDNTPYGYSVDFAQFKYDGLYVQLMGNQDLSYFVYENGEFKPKTGMNSDKFYSNSYAPRYVSADDSHTFWVEGRDGKSAVFVGDKDGNNEKQVALLSDLSSYGWYGNDYLLLSNSKSELFILPITGGQPMKITDYYKN
jgi:hypothetical protein